MACSICEGNVRIALDMAEAGDFDMEGGASADEFSHAEEVACAGRKIAERIRSSCRHEPSEASEESARVAAVYRAAVRLGDAWQRAADGEIGGLAPAQLDLWRALGLEISTPDSARKEPSDGR